MRGLVIVDKGLEAVSKKEIVELIKEKGTTEETTITFSITKMEEICVLCYKAQSIRRVLLLLGKTKISDNLESTVKEIKKITSKLKLNKWLEKNQTFKIECERVGAHKFTSVDIEQEVGVSLKTSLDVSLKNPDLMIYVYIYKNKCYIGLDLSGRDLSKRYYKIFSSSKSVKGTIAYSLIRAVDYKKNELLVDPLSECGVLTIETAIFSTNLPINYYKKRFAFTKLKPFKKIDVEKIFEKEDKKVKKTKAKIYAYDSSLKNINASKKNAKIAGTEKNINFSKIEIEWLDTKFEKTSIDKIVTHLPCASKRIDKNKIKKIYEEFFYQAKFILKPKGLIGIICMKKDLLIEIAEKQDFIVEKERIVYSGQQPINLFVFKKR